MANALQLRRGTTVEHSTFTGLVGEVTVDTTKDTVVVHDGSTAGGFPLAKFSDLTIANVTNLQTSLDAKVDLAGDTMTGFLTLSADPTSNLHASTKQYVDTSIANLVDTAPSTLDTLNELAAALGDDPNFATTVTNSIATKVAKAGDTMTGDLAFGDNVKATFGASADLEIYHDGSNSYISDQGTGDLQIQATNLALRDSAGSVYLYASSGGSVLLRHNNATKIETTSTGVSVTGNITVTGTVDGRDVAADGTKLDGIEAGADVTDTANVTAAGALMDSELTNITAVKALNQGVSTGDSPTFAGLTSTGDVYLGNGDTVRLGSGNYAQIAHDGSDFYLVSALGSTYIRANADDNDIYLQSDNGSGGTTNYVTCSGSNGEVKLYHYGSEKLATQSGGIAVTGNVAASGYVGLNAANYISFSNNAHGSFVVNGGERARLESDGDFHADGDVIAYSTTISDPRLKTDIQKIEGALDKLCTLSGYTFTYTPDGKESAGVMSTEVAKVLPSAIRPKKLPLKTGDEETVYDTVQYDQLHGLLIEAIKELREEVADLKAKIEG
jgi:hypothetical protein